MSENETDLEADSESTDYNSSDSDSSLMPAMSQVGLSRPVARILRRGVIKDRTHYHAGFFLLAAGHWPRPLYDI